MVSYSGAAGGDIGVPAERIQADDVQDPPPPSSAPSPPFLLDDFPRIVDITPDFASVDKLNKTKVLLTLDRPLSSLRPDQNLFIGFFRWPEVDARGVFSWLPGGLDTTTRGVITFSDLGVAVSPATFLTPWSVKCSCPKDLCAPPPAVGSQQHQSSVAKSSSTRNVVLFCSSGDQSASQLQFLLAQSLTAVLSRGGGAHHLDIAAIDQQQQRPELSVLSRISDTVFTIEEVPQQQHSVPSEDAPATGARGGGGRE